MIKVPRLYLDIETIPNAQFATPPPEPVIVEPKPVPGNIKDAAKIQARAADNKAKAEQATQEQYKTAQKKHEDHFRSYALYAWKSQIISIAYAFDDDAPCCLVDRSERGLLGSFFEAIESTRIKFDVPSFQWCAYNGKAFDLPLLEARRIYHNLASANPIPWDTKPWEHSVVLDPMTRLPFIKDRKTMASVCSVLGLPTPVGSGAQVYDQYTAGLLDKIKEHNIQDVICMRALCQRCGL